MDVIWRKTGPFPNGFDHDSDGASYFHQNVGSGPFFGSEMAALKRPPSCVRIIGSYPNLTLNKSIFISIIISNSPYLSQSKTHHIISLFL